jgi:hypothetical protein
MQKFFIILWICFLGIAFLSADTLVLKNKKILEGSIIYSDPEWIKIRDGSNSILMVSQEDVFTIHYTQGPGSYIRYTPIRKGRSALEVAVKTFSNPEKTKFVTLAGAVHIADQRYYSELQKILDDHDVVLFEGVGSVSEEDLSQWQPPSPEVREEELAGERHSSQKFRKSEVASLDFLTTLQTSIGQFLNLTFQKDGINYARSWWKAADVSIEELQTLMEEKGASFLDIMTLSQNKEMEQQVNQILASAVRNFATVLLGKPLDVAGKETLGELLSSQMALMDPTHKKEDGKATSLPKIMEVLIVCRNDKVFQCIQDVLHVPSIQTIAVFYGAGHNGDLEKRLKELNYSLHQEEWLIAWDIIDPTSSLKAPEEEED